MHARGRALNRSVFVIAESNLNDPRLTRPAGRGGYGLDAADVDSSAHQRFRTEEHAMRIFVSSSFEDLQEYRIAAIRVLR